MLHCGGNDFGKVPILKLRNDMKEDFIEIKKLLPDSCIVWSQILPRPRWLNGDIELEKSRERVNSTIAKTVLEKHYGAYIKYPDIKIKSKVMFLEDGVHLSDLGNEIFLNIIQGGLEQIISGVGNVFPDMNT